MLPILSSLLFGPEPQNTLIYSRDSSMVKLITSEMNYHVALCQRSMYWCKGLACVWPVNCTYISSDRVFIELCECIDCGLCIHVCSVSAIQATDPTSR